MWAIPANTLLGLQQEGVHLAEAFVISQAEWFPAQITKAHLTDATQEVHYGVEGLHIRQREVICDTHHHLPQRVETQHMSGIKALGTVAMVKDQWLWIVLNIFGFFVRLFDQIYAPGWICACICFGLQLSICHFQH